MILNLFIIHLGKQLFFASNRPIDDSERSDYNLWVVDRRSNGWGTPTPLPTLINTNKDEFYPAVADNGNLYFTATYENGIGKEDIFKSELIEGQYQVPVPLDTFVNSQTFEFNAYVSPDESVIIFSSYGREDDMGGSDLYLSQTDVNGNWTKARHLGSEINSDKLDYCPFIDFARGAFYFTSQRSGSSDGFNTIAEFEKYLNAVGNGMGDIYWTSIKSLNLEE